MKHRQIKTLNFQVILSINFGPSSWPKGAVLAAVSALGLSAMGSSRPAAAATAIQTIQSFTATDVFNSFTESASSQIYRASVPSFSVQPFSSSLGTFISAQIDWTTSYVLTGVVGSATTSGSANPSYGGSVYLNANIYSGYGGGGGSGGPSGSSITATASIQGTSTTFLPANANVTYNPAILAALLGASPYVLSYQNPTNPGNTPYSLNYTNITSGTATATTRATVTYRYIPVPGPLPLIGAGAAWSWSRRLRRRYGASSLR